MKLKQDRFRPWQFMRGNLKDARTWRHSLLHLIPFWLKGFTTEHILLLGLTKENWQDFMQDALRYRVTLATNQHVWPILHDKLIFDNFAKDKLPIVLPLFAIIKQKYHALTTGYQFSHWVDELKEGKRFVIKPAQGGMGFGMFFVHGNQEKVYVNREEQSYDEFKTFVSGLEYHLTYPFIEQHTEIARLYPDSSNTLRITAYVDNQGQSRMLATVLRAGSKNAAPLDSFYRGGILTLVDNDTGTVIKGLSRDGKDSVKEIDSHPETGEKFIGIQVPYWNQIKRTILGFHTAYPAFDMVGWDVLVTPQGFYVLEGNHNPGIRLPLMFKNLSQEPEFRDFCEKRNLIQAKKP